VGRAVYIVVNNLSTQMSVVSVRVDEKVKRRLEEAGVDVPAEVRKHLEDLAWRVELRQRMAYLREKIKDVPPAPRGFASKSVREDRESH
jgi:polyhydroxyalkanoate synthesis regulator phasin